MKPPQEENFAALLQEFEGKNARRAEPDVRVGDSVRGHVVSLGRETAFVELAGGKTEGMIDLQQLRDQDGYLTV